jgi:hypothetical protein
VEFGGHRGAADIDQAAPINLDYEYAPVTFALARQPKNRRQKDAIVPYCGQTMTRNALVFANRTAQLWRQMRRLQFRFWHF